MIVITGAAGFIGSNMLQHLNRLGRSDLVLVDDFSSEPKRTNWCIASFNELLSPNEFFQWAENHIELIDYILHFGAITDDSIEEYSILKIWNVEYSQKLWSFATKKRIPLLYCSSAGTYGAGEQGFSDDTTKILNLRPQNLIDRSKHEFDCWVMKQSICPPLWAGFKLFDVYGPNETHKKNAASAIQLIYNQIIEDKKITLPIVSSNEQNKHEPLRDMIAVQDVCTVITWFMNHWPASGIYNLGTGYPRPMSAITKIITAQLKIEIPISFSSEINALFKNYLSDNQANIRKLRNQGYKKSFYSLEQGIKKMLRRG